MDGIDSEVVPAFGEALDGIVLTEIEQVFDAQHHKSCGTVAHRFVSEVQLLHKAGRERVRQGAHLLVDDAELDVHEWFWVQKTFNESQETSVRVALYRREMENAKLSDFVPLGTEDNRWSLSLDVDFVGN